MRVADLTADAPSSVESTARWEPVDGGGTIAIGFDIEGEGIDAERVRTDVVPMGEAIVFLTRHASRAAYGDE